jgi:acyl-CoA reductase-like NAD-dependent aldehyde dehydrogenase
MRSLSARETGSTVPYSAFQQDLVANTLQQSAGWVHLNKGEVLQSNQPFHAHSAGVHRPLGVVVSFTPWNGANILSWRAVISPIAAGNTVVVKPSEFAPVNAGILLAEIAEKARFPPGVINAVMHAPGGPGDLAFNSPDVRFINRIGGVKTARILAQRAGNAQADRAEARRLQPDADPRRCRHGLRSANRHVRLVLPPGPDLPQHAQIIISPLAVRRVRREVRRAGEHPELKKGDPLDPSTIIGPLITQNAVDLVHARVKDAVDKGAVVRAGDKSDGLVVEPTILTDVPHTAVAANEETFGPVVIVEPVDSDDEAVAAANRVMYGLTASILTRGHLSWLRTDAAHLDGHRQRQLTHRQR